MSQAPLTGTVGVITGAGTPSGIGRTAVLKYAAAGAQTIYACDIVEDHFSSLIELVQQSGYEAKVIGVKVDVTKPKDVEGLIRKVIGEAGRLDWFFANAGVVDFEPFGTTTEQNIQRAFSINTLGVFHCIQWASRGMMNTSLFKPEAGGSIVVTTSLASTFGGMGSPAYTASKAAAVGILKSAASQFMAGNVAIRVNGVAPGPVATTISENAARSGAISGPTMVIMAEKSKSVTPEFMASVAPPEEVADVAVFLSSPGSIGINGQNIVVDRGSRERVVPMSGVFETVAPEPI